MQAWFHIARRDIRAAASAPLLWLVLAAWTGIVHAVFALSLLHAHGQSGAASIPLYVEALWWGSLALVLIAPAMTMNAWASERTQGTWQLLMTLPVRERDLVLGKFIAALVQLLVLLIATAGLPLTLACVSEVAGPHLTACYVGMVLLAMLIAALGTWLGLLLDGPVATWVVTFAVMSLLWLAGAGGTDGPLGPVASALGLGPRIGHFLAGRIDLADTLWFIAGTVVLLVLAHSTLITHRQHQSTHWSRRVGAIGGPALVFALCGLIAIAAASRSGIAIDLSADHRFTVEPTLVQRVQGATSPTALLGIWSDNDDGTLAPIADVCRRLSDLSAQTSWRRLDPVRHRPQLVDFESHHGAAEAPSLWVVQGKRAQRIALHRGSRITIQRDIAGTLMTLADPHPPTVHIVSGHGELRMNGGLSNGCDALIGHLTANGLRTAVMDEASSAPPPGDVIALLGPTASIGPHLLGRLATHLRDGGGILVLADDLAPRDLGLWLRRHGMLIAGSVPLALVEQQDVSAVLRDDAEVLPAAHLVSLAHHVIGQERDLPHHNLLLRGRDQLNAEAALTSHLISGGLQLLAPFSIACEALPVQVVSVTGTPQFTATPLLRTLSGDVWERSRGAALEIPRGLDSADARTLAWAIAYQSENDAAASGHGGRLVIWGSRQSGSDAVISQTSFANAQFIAGACRWLAGREPPPEVPEAEFRPFQVDASDQTLDLLIGILVALIPVLCIGAAVLAWFEQRR